MEPHEEQIRYSLWSIITDVGTVDPQYFFDVNGRRFYTSEPHGFQTDDCVHITITKEPKPDAQQDAVQP